MKGRLPVHTDCWGGGDRGRGGAEGGGGEIEKMDVETETRSGGRLQGQLYQVDGNKMENSVSTFFMRLLANFSRQHAPAQRTSHEDINVCIPVAAVEATVFNLANLRLFLSPVVEHTGHGVIDKDDVIILSMKEKRRE